MNRHPYPNKHDGPRVDLQTKALWSLTVMKIKCPLCGSDPGFYCERTPPAKSTGAKRWPPHVERVAEMRKLDPNAGVLRALSFSDVMQALIGDQP